MNNYIQESTSVIINNLPIIETLLASFATIVLEGKVNKAFRLRKEYNNRNLLIFEMPEIIKEKVREINNNNITEKHRKELLRFERIFKYNFGDECLDIFYKNINSLKIYVNNENTKRLLIANRPSGSYSYKNEITLNSKSSNATLYHELLHLSSTLVEDDIIYTGFNQQSYKYGDYGRGLNEGYTEHLNKTYFCKYSVSAPYYEYLRDMAHVLEVILDNDFMQKCYFKADMLSVCNRLSFLVGEEDTLKLIKSLDYIYYFFKRKDHFLQEDLVLDAFREVNRILIKAFMERLKKYNYNEEEENIKIKGLLEYLKENFYSGDKTYYIHDTVDLKEIVEKYRENKHI